MSAIRSNVGSQSTVVLSFVNILVLEIVARVSLSL